MNNFRYLLATVIAAVTLAMTGHASAAPGLYQIVTAEGDYYTDSFVLVNSNSGQVLPTADGSSYWFVSCVGSQPGEVCGWNPNPPPPPSSWYQLPNLGSAASAQAHTPDYGLNRARAWSRGTNGINSGDPGFTDFGSVADSGWREEITTTSAVPVVITFVVALHVDWNDGGTWAFQMGRPGGYDPDLGFAQMLGHTWSNCGAQPVSGECTFEYYTGDTADSLTVLPGGDNGSAQIVVTQQFTVYPDSFADPEDPNPFTNPFAAVFGARADANDAEVLGFPGAHLVAILAPSGANLTFASGHDYNVVVPEPGAAASLASGIAMIALFHRRCRSGTSRTNFRYEADEVS